MPAIAPSTVKQPKFSSFQTQLNWLGGKKGSFHASGVQGTIYVATPEQFGGEGHEWSPEDLFLGSISSCFMTTFLFFADRVGLHLSNFSCGANGTVELVNGSYRFTHIDLFPKVHIMDESMHGKTELVLEKTKQYCLVTASLGCTIDYHVDVMVGYRSKQMKSKNDQHIL